MTDVWERKREKERDRETDKMEEGEEEEEALTGASWVGISDTGWQRNVDLHILNLRTYTHTCTHTHTYTCTHTHTCTQGTNIIYGGLL